MTLDIVRTIEPLIPALRRYARALVRDPWDADDLVQDCLERAIGRWHQRRDDDSTRAWVFTILHNLAMTRLRRTARQPHMLPIDGEEAASTYTTQCTTQEERLHFQDMLDALAQLPEEQRSVLLLVAVEDLSYVQAAKVLDIPVGTIMSRLSRARDRLHQLLSGEPVPGKPVQRVRTKLGIVKRSMNGE